MALISFPFKRTNRAQYQKSAAVLTDDALHWKKLGSPVLVKELGAIDYLDFSPIAPYNFAVTCSVRIQIYNPITKLVTRNLGRFRETAYGGSFRADGRLLVAGGEEQAVKLFDVQSRALLRLFTGHTAAVHRTFFTKDQTKVVSFSDDKSVAVWDIASEKQVFTFAEHSDYIRAGAASPISPDIILSGGYDNLLKLYDCRSSETILTVNHGSPIESTLFLPSGGIFISGGGTEIKVWDIFNGGKLLANISQHHKTVTTLRLASNNSRLLSSSLDRHVKIYDISTFQVVHNIDFPNAVLSLAISENDDTLVAGMVDGIISIRKREEPVKSLVDDKKVLFKFAPDHVSSTVDENVERPVIAKESKYDHHLRKMEFSKALQVVLRPYVASKTPEATVALMQELLRRGVLGIAFSELQEKWIGILLKFIMNNLGIPRFTRTIIDVANVFTDIFGHQIRMFSEENILLFNKLQEHVTEEVDICKQLCEIEGAISLLLSGAQTGSTATQEISDPTTALIPSSNAQAFIISV